MAAPLLLFLLSLCGLAAALLVPGLSDLVLLAGPAALGSLLLLVRAWASSRRAGRESRRAYIVVDGSNVMHWGGDGPRIETLNEVLRQLERLGYTPGVVFDANAGHLLEGRYRHDGAFARRLHLPCDRVMVVDRGTPADPVILEAARDMNARVVTNDRYRDWATRFPEVRRSGFLVQGGFRKKRLWLDIGPADGVHASGAVTVKAG
jgi:hypothetical protein